MRSIILFIVVFFTSLWLKAQSVIPGKFPEVTLSIKLEDKEYSTSDSVKIKVTYTNKTKAIQKVYRLNDTETFNPMALTAEVENEAGESMIKYPTREVLSSQLYTEEMLANKKMIRYLKPGEQLSALIYLRRIPVYKTNDGRLPKGTYKVRLRFFTNSSNVESFKVL